MLQVVELKEKETSPCEMECCFYLAVVKHSSIEDNPNDDSIETEIPKMYLKVQTLIEFDTFVTTHGPFTSVDGEHFVFCNNSLNSSSLNGSCHYTQL